MSMGMGIFLVAFGAILAFAIDGGPDWLRVNVVGWVLILTGITMLTLTLTVWSKRRKAGTITEQQVYKNGEKTTTERRVYHGDTPPPE